LLVALARQIDLMSARHGLAMDADLGEEPDLQLDAKEALYRIAQEALNNIANHAQAQHVSVHLRTEPHGVILEISDDGRGFDTAMPHPGHIGLQSMRERAERARGTFDIESALGQGTRIHARIPRGLATTNG
jgi:signal transduction histidine kinase